MEEIWKNIKDFEGLYQVNNLGIVNSLERTVVYSNGAVHKHKAGIKIPHLNNNGYLWKYAV